MRTSAHRRYGWKALAAAIGCALIGCAARAPPAAPPAATVPSPPVGAPIEPIELIPREMAERAAAADAQFGAGRTTEAIASYRALLAAAERDYGPESIETAQAIAMLAGALDRLLLHTEAEPLHRRKQAIVTAHYAEWRAAGRHADIDADAERRALDPYGESLALNLVRQGRHAEANVVNERIRALRAQAGDHLWQPTEIAVRGGLPSVVSYHLTRVPAETRPPTPEEQTRMIQLSQTMQSAVGASDFERVETPYRALLALQEATLGRAHAETIETRRIYAWALLARGRNAEAETAARAVLALHGTTPANADISAGLEFLVAQALRAQERWDDAAPFLDRAFAALVEGRSSSAAIDVALALGDNHVRRGNPAEAERAYRVAGDAYARDRGPHHPDALGIRQMVAYLLGQQGRFAEATAAYRQVCLGRIERARAFTRGELVGEGSSTRTADASECGRRLANALRRVALSTGGAAPDAALRDEAFDAAQVFQQSAAGDSLARSGARTVAGTVGAGGLADNYEARLVERAAVDEGLRGATGDDAANVARRTALNADRQRLDGEIARLAIDLADRQPLYWDLRAPQPLSLAALQTGVGGEPALLRDDEALVLFMVPRGAITGLVFVASRRGAAWADIPLTGDALEARVRALRVQIDPFGYGARPARPADPRRRLGRGRFDRRAAYDLYRALFGDPAIQAVIADTPTLLIVPSGPLTSLPPGLLVTAPPEGGAAGDSDQAVLRRTPWLLRSKAIALLPSVSSLRTLRRLLPAAPQPTEPLLAFTNPDFVGIGSLFAPRRPGLPRSMASYFRQGVPLREALRGLPPLPGTAIEGAALAAALGAPPEAILTGAEASKAALLARNADGRLARVRVIEFATHGLIAGDATGLVEPSLALAAGATAEDGLLTASEAARLTIHADWVLLSACNTASPDATGADGLSGLSRAFFHAGARSLLVSHWRVNDGIAQVLVPAILAAMARDRGLSRAAAVQLASLAILDDSGIDAAHPAMWAPFTLIGEAGR